MKNTNIVVFIITRIFMIFIGYSLLTIHLKSDLLPKAITIGCGVFILLVSTISIFARISNLKK